MSGRYNAQGDTRLTRIYTYMPGQTDVDSGGPR